MQGIREPAARKGEILLCRGGIPSIFFRIAPPAAKKHGGGKNPDCPDIAFYAPHHSRPEP